MKVKKWVSGLKKHNKAKLDKIINKAQQKRFLLPISILTFGLIGLVLLLITKAAPFTASIQPESGNRNNVSISSAPGTSNGGAIVFGSGTASSCGKRVQNYNYQVPFGNAVWNQPVCNLPRYSQSADYAERFYKWANFNDGSIEGQQRWGDLSIGFGLEPSGSNWARHVYFAKDATQQRQITTVSWPSNLDGHLWNDNPSIAKPGYESNLPSSTIPWNPAWVTGDAGDSEIMIIDESNGKIYEVYGYKTDANFQHFPSCAIAWSQGRLCTNTVAIGRDTTGKIIDYRSFEGPLPYRGVGLSGYATFTMPQEVLAGEIRHALGIAIPNTSFGAPCTSSQLGTSAEGKTCGTAVAPATKFEWGSAEYKTLVMAKTDFYKSFYTIDKTIPEGMRFALDIDDAYIENWINSRPNLKSNARKAETARIFARAIRDYGFIVADSGGDGAGVQMAGALDNNTRELWRQAGLESYDDYNLLEGLIKQDKLYVVEPPTVKCIDGKTSKHYCLWTEAKY